METNVRIKRVVEWIQPYFGNRHTMPYGKLEVTDGVMTKIVKTKGDVLGEFEKYGCQYIMFNRKPYELVHYYEGNKHKVTITIGVAPYKKDISVEKWIDLADEKMYIGKNSGKNQIVS